jgi:signal transduction histidine kinase
MPAPINLQTLRNALAQLETHTLPRKTRDALQQAQAQLNIITETLAESEEQSRLAVLYRVSQVLGESLNLDDVLSQVMDGVIQLTGAERGFLMLHDPESDTLDLQAARNFEKENLQARGMEVSRSLIRQVLDSGEAVVTMNAQDDPRFAEQASVIAYALRSIMCAPLQSRGRAIGVVYVDNRAQAGLFGEDDLNLLNTFAAQAAIAIENARLYTLTDQSLAARVAELETLTQINRELNARLDLDHVLSLTCTLATLNTNAVDGWLALHLDDSGDLRIATGKGTGGVLRGSDPLVAGAHDENVPQYFPPGRDALARSVFPLNLAGKHIGVLVLETHDPLDENAAAFMQRLAARAAVAIENARLYQAVQDANLAKSKFVSVVSHELRLPMTSIKGYTDLILQGMVGEISDQQREFLNVIRNNVERMRILVSDLSDVSRIETGRLNLEVGDVPLRTYVEQALTDLRPRLEEKSQSLTLDLPDDLPPLRADPNRLVQVLTNLLSNAWKYTPAGGQITVRANAEGDCVRVAVQDNGLGISPEDQAKLFSQFFRSEDARVREQSGWGLGLNVTRHLVELMGGSIGVESALDAGSTFWFTLPAAGGEPPA